MIDDQLMTVYSDPVVLTKGIPVLRVGKDYVDISGILKENGKTLLDLTYPVGSIYMSINSSNPSILFGRNMGSLGCW